MKIENEAISFCVPGMILPVLHVVADTLPEAWETAVVETWKHGALIKTQYDKPEDPPSKDVCLMMTIRNPLGEPRIHRAFPGGIEDLEVYRQEVVEQIHDHWIDRRGTTDKWRYGYGERIFNYTLDGEQNQWNTKKFDFISVKDRRPSDLILFSTTHVNQLEYVVKTLSEAPHSRRAQIVIWQPSFDTTLYDCPCLQRLFFRIFDDQLVMNVHMRSNDLFKANFMNLFAIIDLQRLVAEKVSEKLGKEIHHGQVNHIVDSGHIYGSYFEEIEGFLKTLKTRTFEQRTWTMEFAQPMIDEAKVKIARSLEQEKLTGRKGI